jgi:predicted  nucleic acid-binding Zn-ribbon protein
MEGMMAIDWLSTLEDKVRAAAERIRSLNEENSALRRRVSELEEQLAAPEDAGASHWEAERQEIRQRVERLTQHLEELVGV